MRSTKLEKTPKPSWCCPSPLGIAQLRSSLPDDSNPVSSPRFSGPNTGQRGSPIVLVERVQNLG